MAHKSDFLENKILDHVLRNTAYTQAATVYVGLYTGAPTDAGGGTEVAGGSYARQSVAFDVAAAGATANSALITFPTATGNWGTLVAAGIFDAVSAGNLLYWNTITNVAINSGDTAKFPIGEIDVTED